MTVQFPATPSVGDPVYEASNGVEYVWDGQKWSSYGSKGGNTQIDSGVNPPVAPSTGDLWFNADNGIMYVYYNDGNSSQWVDVRPGGGGGFDEAPTDGKQYGRQSGAWTETDNIPALPSLPAPTP